MSDSVPIKYPKPTGARWALWQWCDIPTRHDRKAVYLRRLRIINTPLFSIMLHKIYTPDDGEYPHDHPWAFFSLILRGNYVEDVYPGWASYVANKPIRKFHHRWSLHYMPFNSAHHIVSASERLITLVITGPRKRIFRFWTPRGQVQWRYMSPISHTPLRDGDTDEG